MAMDEELTRLQPVIAADRFGPLGAALLVLLRGLGEREWLAPTVASGWRVRDVAAHLLDGACRRLSFERDGHRPPAPGTGHTADADLVAFLNRLNATWVQAFERISPAVLVTLIEAVEPVLAAHMERLDPYGEALFPVAWAGEAASASWFDVARELTERWHHQQQIRLAVGAAPLDDPWTSRPVFDTFVRALPFGYREVGAPVGTAVTLRIAGRELYAYTLRRDAGGWTILGGEGEAATATVELDEAIAWRLFTHGIAGSDARAAARVTGSVDLALPLFATLAVMA